MRDLFERYLKHKMQNGNKSSTVSQKHSSNGHSAVCQKHSLFMQRTGSICAFFFVSLFVNSIWTFITWPTFMWKYTIWVASTIGIKSQQRSEFWLMSQSELAVFTLAEAWIFPLLCRLVKTTTATSVSRPVVSFQRKDLVCHRFHEICGWVSWGNFSSLNLIINNSLDDFSLV